MSSKQPSAVSCQLSAKLAVKRFFDILVCTVMLVLLLPILVLIALIIKLSSPGPIFFVQERVGKDGRIFKMIKFRSMTGSPKPNQTEWTKEEEARITRVGRFLREYGLDELPQLFNIIKGDMSIIGPRAPLPAQINSYTEYERLALKMRPGVTGLSAVKGRYALSPEERRRFNSEYVERWSLGLDFKILLRTIVIVLTRRNAAEYLASYKSETGKKTGG